MSNLFFVSVALGILSGTSLAATAQKPVRFIDGIELRPGAVAENTATVSEVSTQYSPGIPPAISKTFSPHATLSTEACRRLQFKYAQLLNRDVESVSNTALFEFIEEWWNTRYRYGGSTKAGIDCSAFSSLLLNTVFNLSLPRTAKQQYQACTKINKEDMAEGDLLFFNTRGSVSHVGIYLGDGYFVHASTSQGVTINNMADTYYNSRFIGAGRVAGPPTSIAKSL